jgi:hydroxymethylpyrimidine pyrophosphatase-like HAD family hydrolase
MPEIKLLALDLDGTLLTGEKILAYVDIPMFRLAGLSVAMGNAPWEVKQTARVIAPSNNEEGVAWALKKFIFNYEEVKC